MITQLYPGMGRIVKQLMQFRPQRKHRTDVLYIHGPTGIGKTTCIFKTLVSLRELYPDIDYYQKIGGLKGFWDGYDNQPIVACVNER